jgi:general secretion pathway protein B
MSYILEALKKADAERERERAGVPDLHAQPDAVTDDARAGGHHGGWRWALAAAVLGLAWAAWEWLGNAPSAVPESIAPVLAAAPAPTPAPVPLPEPAPAPAAVAAAALPTAITGPGAPVPSRARTPAPTQAPMQTMPRPAAPAAAAARASAPPKTAPPASAPAEARLYTLAELPPDVRAQVPALAIGGSVYSPVAASRIVILNGQVFREGDRPVEGLSVEQIRLKSTVLAFRGYRIELKH